MQNEMTIKNDITINAPSAKVWDALTNPEQTKKYMHGCGVYSDWQPGNPVIWKGVWDGQEMVAVTGNLVSIEPGKFLVYTTFDPNNKNIPDVPENHLTVTYSLEDKGDKTELTVTQGDYNKVAEGEKRYNDSIAGGGWSSILTEIKKIAEE